MLTSDLDWCSEHCVENFLSIAESFSIKPTIFVTHQSPLVRAAARAGRVELGIHPNFLPGSTHGESAAAIIAHVLALVPEATVVRCHCHFTSPEIEQTLAAQGLRIDGNTHHHLARGLAPIPLLGGLLRLPVFFEDDCHWAQHRTWRFADHAADFFGPGLKVLSFHPFLVALNAPSAAFYLRHKRHIPTLTAAEAEELRYAGEGIATFLLEAIRAIKEAGHRFVTLGELADGFLRPGSDPAARCLTVQVQASTAQGSAS